MQPSPETMPLVGPSESRHWGITLLWLTPLGVIILVLVYGGLTRQPADSGSPAPRVGHPLADFTLPDLQGKPVHLAALRGKVVLLNIWATWCPPCIEEMPSLQRLYDRLHAHGLEILAISIDPLGARVVGPFMQSYGWTFPVVLDPQGQVERLYRTRGVPESFLVDTQGRLVEKVVGPRDWSHPRMIALFERLLATPSS